jgi:hypothetical protein
MPRTSLENRYLLSALRKTNIKSIWIDLNSLKAPDCWTIGNSNCPYGDSVFAFYMATIDTLEREFKGAKGFGSYCG